VTQGNFMVEILLSADVKMRYDDAPGKYAILYNNRYRICVNADPSVVGGNMRRYGYYIVMWKMSEERRGNANWWHSW
jgi:hypothetical protein